MTLVHPTRTREPADIEEPGASSASGPSCRRLNTYLQEMIRLKRAYEPAEAADGKRVLVDRLWPRGVSKEAAKIDLWMKDVAPSEELRKWFHHEAANWPEFEKRYRQELKDKTEGLHEIAALAKNGTVTLVYGAKDEEHNQAVVLKEVLERRAE